MSAYSEFFLNSESSVVQLDCLEISHSLFTQTFYVVRNATRGVTVTHEDETEHAYEYYPLKCTLSGPRGDLDHVLRIEFGDLGQVLPQQLDAIRAGNGFSEFPVVRYRTYRSDDLDTVLFGPLYLEVRNMVFKREGCAFEAKAPSLNMKRTGELYSLARFPMLRGL
jgi:hypothetical protein